MGGHSREVHEAKPVDAFRVMMEGTALPQIYTDAPRGFKDRGQHEVEPRRNGATDKNAGWSPSDSYARLGPASRRLRR